MRKRTQGNGSRRRTWPAVLVCAAVLACGFFFAARQHFSSMDFGMKNSRLRKKIDDLESEKRRLLLAREVSLSPGELKKAALKVKTTIADTAAEIASVVTPGKDKTTLQPASATTTTANPVVVKTVATASTKTKPVTASLQKPATRAVTIDRKFVAQRSTAAE